MDIEWLKRSIVSVFAMLFFVFPTRSQQVTVHSFQHVIRWAFSYQLLRYMDVVLLLLFCKGNAQ